MLLNLKKINNKRIFDEKFFLFLEEIDLCKRIKDLGEKIYIAKKARVSHVGKSSSKYDIKIELCKNWHWMWSLFYYNKKHYGFFCAFKITIGKLISSFFKFIFYIFVFRIDKSKIYLCRLLGLINSYLNRPSTYRPKV